MATTERKYVIEGKADLEDARLSHAVRFMDKNKAYLYAKERAGGDSDGIILKQFQDRFRAYRRAWRGNPKQAIEQKLGKEFFDKTGFSPLCLDIETAAYCDLACPFCFRQTIATPDKLIAHELYYRLIDQAAELQIPSIKLNWRGEPLLHPQLPEFIDYAKKKGILEVIINTNATTLNDKKARQLIEAGLDLLIYSFDGGSKTTYERMRPGRFQDNSFDRVYDNIKQFSAVRNEMGSVFPRTKIQMVLTAETFKEKDSFFSLFKDYVDDVSVKAYTERGGELQALDPESRHQVNEFIRQHNLSSDAPYWQNLEGDLFVSKGRLACEQIYQRLMVTYDGRVSMCCYDWGSLYPVGYADEAAYSEGDKPYEEVLEKIKKGAKGFEFMKEAIMPPRFAHPQKHVQTLKAIWNGDIVNDVREKHIRGQLEQVAVCGKCQFKETYQWEKVSSHG